MPCLNRITTINHKLTFADGKHYFYMESVCGNGCDGSICPKCSTKKEKALQTSRSFDHGIIGEAYKEKSHIYDSPWYHKYVKRYGTPSEENLTKAKAAQEKVKEGTPVQVQKQEKKKITRKLQRPKPSITKASIIKEISNDPQTMVETMDEPLAVKQIIEITLQPKKIGSIMYWFDEDRGKLYEYLEKKKGQYVGRWNEETQRICKDVPDSDSDFEISA